MAIKGKAKSRTKKAVTAGPKPVYVPVRKPLLARRSFWVPVAAAVAVAAAGSIWYGLARERAQNREAALGRRERVAVSQYQAVIQSGLAGVGDPAPPDGFQLKPDLQTSIEDLQKGKVTNKSALQTANGAAQAAKSAAKAVGEVDIPKLVQDKGFPFKLVNYLLDSQKKMVNGLKLYGQVALTLAQAAQASGGERDHLLASALGVVPIAKSVFQDGYSDYIEAQYEVGLFVPNFQPPVTAPTP